MTCIIPARGGSKRIPGKNIKSFCGAPVISYPILTAINAGWMCEHCKMNRVIVSTDDRLIADVARSYGADIHERSEYAASDRAETEDVIAEVIETVDDDTICLMYPTSVFATWMDIQDAMHIGDELVFSVVRLRAPIERAMRRIDGRMVFCAEDHNRNSQEYPEAWIDAGQFYLFGAEDFSQYWARGNRLLEMPNTGYVMRHAVDINDPMDWELAESVYRYINAT